MCHSSGYLSLVCVLGVWRKHISNFLCHFKSLNNYSTLLQFFPPNSRAVLLLLTNILNYISHTFINTQLINFVATQFLDRAPHFEKRWLITSGHLSRYTGYPVLKGTARRVMRLNVDPIEAVHEDSCSRCVSKKGTERVRLLENSARAWLLQHQKTPEENRGSKSGHVYYNMSVNIPKKSRELSVSLAATLVTFSRLIDKFSPRKHPKLNLNEPYEHRLNISSQFQMVHFSKQSKTTWTNAKMKC